MSKQIKMPQEEFKRFQKMMGYSMNKRGLKYVEKLKEKFWKGERLDDLQLKNAMLMLPVVAVKNEDIFWYDMFKELQMEFENRFEGITSLHYRDNVIFLRKQGYIEDNE